MMRRWNAQYNKMRSCLVGSSDPRDHMQKPCPVCLDFDIPDKPLMPIRHRRSLGYIAEPNPTGLIQISRAGKLKIFPDELENTSEAGCLSCQVLREIWGRLRQDEYLEYEFDGKYDYFEISTLRTSLLDLIVISIPYHMLSVCFHRVTGNYVTTL